MSSEPTVPFYYSSELLKAAARLVTEGDAVTAGGFPATATVAAPVLRKLTYAECRDLHDLFMQEDRADLKLNADVLDALGDTPGLAEVKAKAEEIYAAQINYHLGRALGASAPAPLPEAVSLSPASAPMARVTDRPLPASFEAAVSEARDLVARLTDLLREF